MDNFQLYSKKVLKHVKDPQNIGEIKNPDGVATVGNPVCGDIMRLYLKIAKRKTQKEKQEEDYIKDVKFQTLGCGAAIATSSMITTMVKGKNFKDAGKITNQAVAEALGGLPLNKMHCSVLAAEALQKAIKNYQQKQKK
ncbi:MAG: iron-sulfur cluster assembly scaffold protein [Candidatus Shapirobacteria bacterium]|nr:iron-sulfur cluster assembly scaffold protein [Candidatus Shapirobacteria bacterium]